jgi:hypothetical protein
LIHHPNRNIFLTRIEVDFGDRKRKLCFRVRHIPHLERNLGDLSAPVVLLAAMRAGRDLVFEEPLSKSRLSALDRVQDKLVGWYPHRMQRVSVTAPRPEKEVPRGSLLRGGKPTPRTVSCFTGGVDSFYSLVTHPEADGIVFVDGLDVPLSAAESLKRVSKSNRAVARAQGIRYHRVESNIRYFLKNTAVSWGFEGHGAALAAVAELLSPRYEKFLIPSTHGEGVQIKWGSHPELDPLWSTKSHEVIHDGGVATRVDKVVRIAAEPLPQQFLRVCFMQHRQDNCGNCMKCLRTMSTLELLDHLKDFKTFPYPLDIGKVAALRIKTRNDFVQFSDLLALSERVGGHEELRGALATILDHYPPLVAQRTAAPERTPAPSNWAPPVGAVLERAGTGP